MEYVREVKVKPESILEIGQRALVKPATSKNPTYYYTNIQDIDENGIYIAVPSDEKGRPVGFRNDEELLVSIPHKGRRFGFVSKVVGRKLKPFFMLAISKPEKIYIVEMRQYFRVPVFIPYFGKRVERVINKEGKPEYKLKSADLKSVIIKGYIHDISGGGAFITADKKLDIKEHILISARLDEDTQITDVPAVVVRKVVLDSRREKEGYGVMFVDIDDKLRDNIIKFCFKRQRELRRSGEL